VRRYRAREHKLPDTHLSSRPSFLSHSQSQLSPDAKNPALRGIHSISTLVPDPISRSHLQPHSQDPGLEESLPPRPPSPEAALLQTQALLEALPIKVLSHARAFYQHVQYFVRPPGTAGGWGAGAGEVSERLKKMLDEIAGVEHLGERVRREILGDESARHASISLSHLMCAKC
jgi:hypothetical protein